MLFILNFLRCACIFDLFEACFLVELLHSGYVHIGYFLQLRSVSHLILAFFIQPVYSLYDKAQFILQLRYILI